MGRRASALGLLAAGLLAPPLAAQAIPGIYADSATLRTVERARDRHRRQDALVNDYRARVVTRLDASAGRSRFARMLPLMAHETAARVTWRRPDDLKMHVEGVRGRAAFGSVEPEVLFERPWFVPRALGDSIRLMGLPETAALHPLAADGATWYRYALTDSLVMQLPGRTVRALSIRVEPRRIGPSLVAGNIWVDATTGDVVRLTVMFLGEFLWDAPDEDDTPADSAEIRKDNRRAQRFLSVEADLEYALYENTYWMPYRQLLRLLVEWDVLLRGAVPVRAVTRFTDYVINGDAPINFVFEPEDTDRVRTRCRGCTREENNAANRAERGFDKAGTSGRGRWEISYPPRDSLRAYEWDEPLALDLTEGDRERIRRATDDLARLAESLPDDWVGRRRHSLQLERVADLVRYNRVQGASVGLGYDVLPGPAFTTLHAGARFGFGDGRLTGRVAWRYDGPAATVEAAVYRAVHEAEPWSRGQGIGNSLNALFTGHDDADYHLAWGAAITYFGNHGFAEDSRLTLAAERHRSMAVEAGWIGGDVLEARSNPTVADGDYVRLGVESVSRLGPARLRSGLEVLAGTDLTADDAPLLHRVRGWGTATVPFRIRRTTGALSVKWGMSSGDDLPQMLFRAGGPATVRGYDYGFRSGRSMWSVQVDWAPVGNWLLAPVLFADAGSAGPGDPLVGVGGGVSAFGGLIRLNLARGLNPDTDIRFDLLFQAPR